MFDLKKNLRPHIADLKPYSSARDEYSGKEGVFLDANENSLGSTTGNLYNRYPDPYQWMLKEKIAAIKRVNKEQIFLGNGSDEAIDLLFRAFCRPGKDNIIILPPTYGMYEVSASINDVEVRKVPLTLEFDINIKAIYAAIDSNTKILFICSPNNPTGNEINRNLVLDLLGSVDCLVVIDEAYIDFSGQPGFSGKLSSYPNLVVLQTFSKAWGLAALRLGMAFASPGIISVLNKIKPPYNINALTQEFALEALQHRGKKDQMVDEILKERAFLHQSLLELTIIKKIFPSEANFILVKVNGAPEIYDYLLNKKIIVRDRSKVALCEDCLRITVGSQMENKLLLDELKKIANNSGR